jgi:hypothetical protein
MRGLETAHDAGARAHNNSWGGGDVVTNNLYWSASTGNIDRFCYLHPDSLVLFAAHNQEGDRQPAPGGNGVLDANRLPAQAVAKNVLTIGATENQRNNDGWQELRRTSADLRPRRTRSTANAGAGYSIATRPMTCVVQQSRCRRHGIRWAPSSRLAASRPTWLRVGRT